MNDLAAGVLAVTLAAVVVRQFLGRGLPLAALFAAGAFGMLLLGGLTVPDAGESLVANAPVLIFLFALFVFVAALERAGALEHLARWAVGLARRPEDLPLVLFGTLGALSAFVVNDALVLVAVPVVIALARRIGTGPEPLVLTTAYSVSVGSALTPFGNPQNLLVSLQSGLPDPVSSFFRYLLIPTVLGLLVGGLYLRWALPISRAPPGTGAGPGDPPRLIPRGGWGPRLRRAPVLALFPATLLVLIGADAVTSLARVPPVPLDAIALVGAAAVLAATRGRAGLLRRVNWSILALFAALFVVVAGAVHGGVLAALDDLLGLPTAAAPPSVVVPRVVAASFVGSQLISNVPWVGLQIPTLHHLGFGGSTPVVWVALAAGSTLAGNATLLGAASNLIVVEQADRLGVRIRLARFVRFGLPLALLTTGILIASLLLGI